MSSTGSPPPNPFILSQVEPLPKAWNRLVELTTSETFPKTSLWPKGFEHLSANMATLNARPTVLNHWNALAALSNFTSNLIRWEGTEPPQSLSPEVARALSLASLCLCLSIIQSLESLYSTPAGQI